MPLKAGARVATAEPDLKRLAVVVTQELFTVSGVDHAVTGGTPRAGDIVLKLDRVLKPGEYELTIDDRITVRGGDASGVAMGTTTLLQALRPDGRAPSVPKLVIRDKPAYPYVGAMLDVARKPYSLETLRQCVQTCLFYKIRYLHLHMSDENAWTFPSTAFPQLGSTNVAWAGGEKPTVYPLKDLRELVAFADARGVTLVPELEVPGHSGALRGCLPEAFSYRDASGKLVGLGVVNMASEKALAALDTIIGEMADVFRSSPYIHLGSDEASIGGIEEMPEVKEVTAREKLPYPHAVFNYFLHRLHGIVRKHGKQMIVWEGAPVGPNPLPKDVIFMPWVGHSDAAKDLVADGYRVINAPWGVKTPVFDPRVCNQARLKESEPLLLGATGILWEAPEETAIPYLRQNAAIRADGTHNPSPRPFPDLLRRLTATDRLLDRLLSGFSLELAQPLPPTVQGRIDPLFATPTKLSARGPAAGSVRITLDGTLPTSSSPKLASLRLDDTVSVKARDFDAAGKPNGALFAREFRRLTEIKHKGRGWKVTIEPNDPGYFGPGPSGLTDGYLASGYNFHFPGWVGWEATRPAPQVTLESPQPTRIDSVAVHALRSPGGVDLPKSVEILASVDGRSFLPVTTISGQEGLRSRGWYTAQTKSVMAKFLRITAQHGGDWTFLDEIAVNPVALPAPVVPHMALGKMATVAKEPYVYTSPGIRGLTDGYVCREINFVAPEWLGFNAAPLDATIDLGEVKPVRSVGGHFLQLVRYGIYYPAMTEVLVSEDWKAFRSVGKLESPPDGVPEGLKTVEISLKGVRTRYARLTAKSHGEWLFCDELVVR